MHSSRMRTLRFSGRRGWGGGCLPGGGGRGGLPDRMTDTCKNITKTLKIPCSKSSERRGVVAHKYQKPLQRSVNVQIRAAEHSCSGARKSVAVARFITARKRSLRQGYMFTCVCLSMGGGCMVPEGLCAWSGGAPGGDPPRRLLLRAVRILLECTLDKSKMQKALNT